MVQENKRIELPAGNKNKQLQIRKPVIKMDQNKDLEVKLDQLIRTIGQLTKRVEILSNTVGRLANAAEQIAQNKKEN